MALGDNTIADMDRCRALLEPGRHSLGKASSLVLGPQTQKNEVNLRSRIISTPAREKLFHGMGEVHVESGIWGREMRTCGAG